MRAFAIASLAALGLTVHLSSPASAADIAPAAPAPVYVKAPVVVPYSWTGFYVGGNAGYTWSSNTVTQTGTDTGGEGLGSFLAAGAIPASERLQSKGFISGLQAGYNWQAGPVVYGFESDIQWANAKSSFAITPPSGGFVPTTTTVSQNLDWLATARARLGFTLTPTTLVYGSGGLAYGENKLSLGAFAPTILPPIASAATTAKTRLGWTAGGGIEYAFAAHWSAKAEYLFYDLGSISTTINYAYPGQNSSLTATTNDRGHIARFGINYKF